MCDKKTVIIFILLIASVNLWSQQIKDMGAGFGLRIETPQSTGLSYSENNLPQQALARLRTNFTNYTHFYVIDTANRNMFENEMMQSESAIFAENQLEVGNLMAATYFLTSSISKSTSIGETRWTVTLTLSETSTGTQIAMAQHSGNDKELSDNTIIDYATYILLVERLAFKLLPIAQDELRHENRTHSVSEMNNMMFEINNEIKDIEKRQQDLEKQYANIMNEQQARQKQAEENRLEVSLMRLEQERASLNMRIEREQRQADRDRIADENARKLTEDTQKRFLAQQEVLLNFRRNQEALLSDNITAESRINSIEERKQNLSMMVNENLNIYNYIKNSMDSNLQNDLNKIEIEMSDPKLYPAAFNKKGELTDSAKKNIESKQNERRKEIENELAVRREEALKNADSIENPLIKDITDSIKNLESIKFTETTLDSDSLELVISDYDGDRHQWDTTLNYYIEGQKIYSTNHSFSYKDITGYEVPQNVYDSDYNQNVYYFTSLFHQRVPMLQARIEYNVKAISPTTQAASYRTVISKIEYYLIENAGEKNLTTNIKYNETVEWQFAANQAIVKNTRQSLSMIEKEEKMRLAEYKRRVAMIEKEEKKQEKKLLSDANQAKRGGTIAVGYKGMWGGQFEYMSGLTVKADMPFAKYFYIGVGIDFTFIDFAFVTEGKALHGFASLYGDFGLFYHIGSRFFPFIEASLGFFYDTEKDDLNFFAGASAGFDIWVGGPIKLTAKYGIEYYNTHALFNKFSAGIGFRF